MICRRREGFFREMSDGNEVSVWRSPIAKQVPSGSRLFDADGEHGGVVAFLSNLVALDPLQTA
jgi:hypothetical protein